MCAHTTSPSHCLSMGIPFAFVGCNSKVPFLQQLPECGKAIVGQNLSNYFTYLYSGFNQYLLIESLCIYLCIFVMCGVEWQLDGK